MTQPRERDYEAIMEAREEERADLYLRRMDAIYGRVEDHRTNGWTVEAHAPAGPDAQLGWTKWTEWVDRATAESELVRARSEGLTARIVRAS